MAQGAGHSDDDRIVSLTSLGLAYADLGRYDLAGDYHERSLALRQKVYPEQSMAVATGLRNIADPDVGLAEAVMWAAVSGTLIGVARMLATRRAANYYARSTGHLPPQLQKDGQDATNAPAPTCCAACITRPTGSRTRSGASAPEQVRADSAGGRTPTRSARTAPRSPGP